MAWNPSVYNQFKNERNAPFYDLCELCKPRQGLKVIDLGCGTGELTGKLSEYLPDADILGIDSSPEMLKESDKYKSSNVRFQCVPIEEQIKSGGSWDLVFSNAALQWVDDHHQLFQNLFSMIAVGGQLAVQIPSNHDHFTHVFLRELAGMSPFKNALSGWVRYTPVLTIGEYADLLFKLGAADITVFEKVYPHVLQQADSLVEWVSGTALIGYLERLPEQLGLQFKEQFRQAIADHFRESPVFYPFKRILLSALHT